MTTGYNVLLRNAQLDAISAFAGAGALIQLFDGVRPVTGGAVTNILNIATLGTPFAPPAVGGMLSPNLPANSLGLYAGTATWFRIFKSDGITPVLDGSIGTDLVLSSATISVGVTVSYSAFSITRGNP